MKIVVLASRFPYPLEKGDKLRLYHQLRYLAQKHKVVLVALSEEKVSASDLAALEAFCEKVHVLPLSKSLFIFRLLFGWLRGLPLQVAYFYNKALQRGIDKIIETEKPAAIYCQLIRTAYFVRAQPGLKILDYMDCFSVNTSRWAEQSKWWIRPILKMEAARLRSFEQKSFQWFSHHSIISEQDRDLMPLAERAKIVVVSNGVDTDFFQPLPAASKKFDLVFVGNMGYVPNVDAALFLAKELMPLIWEKRPETTLLIAGARPRPEVLQLQQERVTVSGWMEDIREAYSASSVFVAPLFIGSGQQNKILESMAMGIPAVTTSLVNNAIGASPEKEICIADDKEAFVNQILILLNDTNKIAEISKAAVLFVRQRYSWEGATAKIDALLSERAT